MQQIAVHSNYMMIDLTQAYHKLPVHKEDSPLRVFMQEGKQYMLKKILFDFKILYSLYQTGM